MPHIKKLVNTGTLRDLLQFHHSLPPPGIRPGNCLVFRVSSILPRLLMRLSWGSTQEPHRAQTSKGPLKYLLTTKTWADSVIKLPGLMCSFHSWTTQSSVPWPSCTKENHTDYLIQKRCTCDLCLDTFQMNKNSDWFSMTKTSWSCCMQSASHIFYYKNNETKQVWT